MTLTTVPSSGIAAKRQGRPKGASRHCVSIRTNSASFLVRIILILFYVYAFHFYLFLCIVQSFFIFKNDFNYLFDHIYIVIYHCIMVTIYCVFTEGALPRAALWDLDHIYTP
jgi:hypothetical protein